jgi:queuosine precursor transporter
MNQLFSRGQLLFVVLTGLFITNVLIAEFVGVKIFALEPTLGLDTFNWRLFGQSGSLSFTAGVMLWPVVFVMTDIINEYYGPRGVRFLSWLAVALIVYAFAFAYLAIWLVPATWWLTVMAPAGVPDMQAAFSAVFGQALWTIAGSVVAFLVAQLIDVSVFHQIRRRTGPRWLGLRATGSTLVSQFIDSYVVLYIAFVLGPQQWPVALFLAVGTVNYFYKGIVAILATPILYLVHRIVDSWLGHEEAERLRAHAAAG